MTSKFADHILHSWGENYSFLTQLPLYGFYKNFYTYFSYSHSNGMCDHYIPYTYKHATDILPVCRIIETILKNFSYFEKLYGSVKIETFCKYLSYFSYEILKNNSSYINVKELYEILKYSSKNYVLHDNCNITNFEIDKEAFDKKKNIFFHSEILNSIKNKSNFSNYDSSEYNKYFQECANTYKEIISDEDCKYNQYCKEELEIFQKQFNETKKYLKENKIDISEDDIELPEKTKCASQDGSFHLPEQQSQSLGSSQDLFSNGEQHRGQNLLRDNSNQNTGINSGVSLGIMGGIIPLSLIFYKYTPFGPWLHSKIARGKKKIDLEEKINQIYLDTSENENINSYNDMYNIQYNSM
ncbi:PIR Superfamily Protein [Plasmodium ovale curtisi]|uniref:PIR Superfamily Protein n=1 Tax=Plasmodium ovale curtisi TaxID=864141 RepID=A0A1A8VNV3_PLAOA|nr:PIR Superfamily Protein [Plasmodium ovale curtisi]